MCDSNKGNILFFVYLEKLLKNLLNFWEHRNINFIFVVWETFPKLKINLLEH